MAKSRPKTPKKVTAKRTKPGTDKGRDDKGKFKAGNKAAEIWTEAAVLKILRAMWKDLTTSTVVDSNDATRIIKIPPPDGNIVRANDIKLLGEICLMHSVSKQRWNEWEDKFAPKLKDGVENNPHYSEPVTDLIKNIRWLLECRLNYSGAVMDIFILKNHYQYKDQSHIDATTKGEKIENPFYSLLKQTGIKQS